jgi:hypothetical protein
MGGFAFKINIMVTFCVILGLFILGRLALYVLSLRCVFCGARFSVARLRETIFFSLFPVKMIFLVAIERR